MTTRAVPKLTAKPKSHKSTVEYEYLGLRPEVTALLREVEDLFFAKHGIKPSHSAAMVNALAFYKAKLTGLKHV